MTDWKQDWQEYARALETQVDNLKSKLKQRPENATIHIHVYLHDVKEKPKRKKRHETLAEYQDKPIQISRRNAAYRLGVSVTTVRQFEKLGWLKPKVNNHGHHWFTVDEIEKLKDERKKGKLKISIPKGFSE